MSDMGRKKKKYRKCEVMKAIRHSEGMLRNVAKELGCGLATAKSLIDEDWECQQEMARRVAVMEDVAKDTIQESLLAGDLNTAKWYLEFQSRAGYRAETQKVQISFVDDIG